MDSFYFYVNFGNYCADLISFNFYVMLFSNGWSFPADAMLAFVSSCVDYCNALPYGVGDLSAEGSASRRCTAILTSTNIGTSRRQYTLHWLPVPRRIIYEIVLTTCDRPRSRIRIVNDVLVPVEARDALLSADHGDMTVPRACTWCYGPHSFRSSATNAWNDHPLEMEDHYVSRIHFKSDFKTWRFRRACSKQTLLRTPLTTRYIQIDSLISSDSIRLNVRNTPFTRYSRLSNRLYNRFDNRLNNRYDNRFDNRLYTWYSRLSNRLSNTVHDTTGCQTGLTTGLTTGCIV